MVVPKTSRPPLPPSGDAEALRAEAERLFAENAELRARVQELESRLVHAEEGRIAAAAVQQNPLDAVLVLARDRRVLFTNDVFAREYQDAFGADVRVGASSLEATPVPLFEWFRDHFRRGFEGERARQTLELELRGARRHLDVSFVPLELDGEICAVAVFSRDVSALVHAAEMRHVTLDATPAAVFELRPLPGDRGRVTDFEITSCNRTATEIMGRTREELVGSRISDLEAGRLLRMDLVRVAEGGEPRAFDVRLRGIDSGANGLPRCLHGRIARAGDMLVMCAIDLSEREALRGRAALDDRIASLGRLALGVAHELNNPLAFMRANLEHARDTIARGGEVAELGAPIDEALAGTRRLARIVEDLRAGTESRPLDPGGIDLAPSIQTAVRTAAHVLLQHARLDVRIAPELPRVLADGARLVQVLLNLLLNAGHALRAAERVGIVRVSAREVPDGVALCVEDDGIGMDDAAVARAFEPFFTTRATDGGSGLGLWVGRSIIESFGGRIELRSRPGVGTVVEVVLSVATTPPAHGAASEPSPPAATPTTRLRVLVVDDERLLRTALRRLLAAHEVVDEGHPQAAIERMRRGERFDVVLCDLAMPDMHGVELADAVLEIDPSMHGRIIAMSGGASHDVELALESRGIRLIDKPFDAAIVRELVARVGSARDDVGAGR
ncbi:MAG: ATP-binding protein [Myxococcota bacterium]|nr:ATP-binding protein [Myxococcota bacterium]